MSAAERAVRLALRAYPADYRVIRGDELAATAFELSAGGGVERELWSLVLGGLAERGRRATGGVASIAWAEGCRLAAFVVLLVTAGVNLRDPGWDLAARVGLGPLDAPFLGGGGWLRWGLAAALPLLAAAGLARGRFVACAALATASTVAFLAGWLPFQAVEQQSLAPAASTLAQAYRLGDALFLAAPAALALAAWRPGRVPAPLSRAWLLVPLLHGLLMTHFWLTSTTFWPLAALVVLWVAAARADVRLGAAAVALLVPLLAVLVPTALGEPQYEYAVAVCAGGIVLTVVALSRALEPT